MFRIDGYWKDDKTEFYGYLVNEYHDVVDEDEDVFYYGLSEVDLIEAIKLGENTIHEFVITNYEVVNEKY